MEALQTPPPCVYLLKEDSVARQTLSENLRSRGFRCRDFASADGLLSAADLTAPGCVVMCCEYSGPRGLEFQRRLTSARKPLPIIVVMMSPTEVPVAVRFMEQGAVSVLEQPASEESLLSAISRAIELSEVQARVRTQFEEINEAVGRLTPRETSVLRAIVAGQLNKAIARSLDVSVRTIEGDRAKIVDKFRAETTGEVVGKYAQYQLLTEMGYPTLGLKDAASPSF